MKKKFVFMLEVPGPEDEWDTASIYFDDDRREVVARVYGDLDLNDKGTMCKRRAKACCDALNKLEKLN